MQLQCIVLESPFSYCAETLLKEKKISLRWTVISAPVTRIMKNKVQAYLTLTPRAIGRNIVGHNSQHCECYMRRPFAHPVVCWDINLGFWETAHLSLP